MSVGDFEFRQENMVRFTREYSDDYSGKRYGINRMINKGNCWEEVQSVQIASGT